MSRRLGACVARARLQARFGSPIPTKTTSPSCSARAATAAIISFGVYSVAIIDSAAWALRRLQPLREPGLPREISCPIRDSVDILVEILLELRGIARDRLPIDVESIIAVV